MRFTKAPTTIEEQIALLRERGLEIPSEDLARRWLMTVGYYRLSAYWLPFEKVPEDGQTRSKQFRQGVRFEEVVDIYTFDRKLRLLVTEAIERIEISVRSRWTNRLTLKHGAHAHMNPELFVSGWKHARMIAALADRTSESREVFIEHYREKYSAPYMPPLWAITELMTFGELSKWVEATDDARLRSAVARDIGLPTQETLTGTLQLLSYTRNICAHHGRLWNRKTVKRAPNIKRFRDSLTWDEEAIEGQLQLSNRIYNVLTLLVLLMRHQASDTTFPERLRGLIEARKEEQKGAMGFPEDWSTRPAWVLL
ncbi:MAG: abortive infection bacteriophage resistance protein [Loktanella salsilacus]|jgi:abortive infection bacteriophage resistance protein|uniref:Abi family protein n=1 Tax=Loktanella salsilacus TaxID=195913 RepID=UPI003988E394